MRCSIEDLPTHNPFVPKRVTIDLETVEEAKSFGHLINCWGTAHLCSHSGGVQEFARKLVRSIPDLPV